MGLFYVTTYVQFSELTTLVSFLQACGRHAYVIPPQKGFTLLFDKELATQNTKAIDTLTQKVAQHFVCTVLSIGNHDDDFLFFSASTQGHSISATSASLAALFQKEHLQSQLDHVLSASHLLAGEQHCQLAKLLGLPFIYAQFDFEELLEADQDLGNTDPFTTKIASRKLLRSLTNADTRKPVLLEHELRKLVKQNRIISAVTLYQQRTGATLQEARSYIDSLQSKSTPS